MIQRQLRADLKDSRLEVESTDAYLELQRRAWGRERVRRFYDTVKKAVARIHMDVQSSMENEWPDGALDNVITTIWNDLRWRTLRKTLWILLSEPAK